MPISGDQLRVDGIGHFLKDQKLAVPTNQRSYAWKSDEHVTDFWDDIKRAVTDHNPDYFIGTIVLSSGDSESPLEVVDGQQRLATATMIIGAIRDWYAAHELEERAEAVEREFLFSKDVDTLEVDPRLSLNDDDDEFFREHVVFRSKDGNRQNPFGQKSRGKKPKDSVKKIADAAGYIRNAIHLYVRGENQTDAVSKLVQMTKYVNKHVKLITVVVPNHEDAYTIFETLNDRGLDLSKADLLKNHLYRTATAKHLKKAQDRWAVVGTAMESTGYKDIMVDYIRYQWISRYGHVRTKNLYKEVKKKIDAPPAAIRYVSDLADDALHYAAILNSDNPHWNKYSDDTRGDVANCIMLGIDRLYPIMLGVVRKFDDSELKKAFYYFVCASVRITFAGPVGGFFEEKVAEVAPLVSDGTIKTARELSAMMAGKFVPIDAEFRAKFEVANVSKPSLAKYYLRAMDNSLDSEVLMPARISRTDPKCSIEHIMPEKLSKDWSHITGDTSKGYLKRLGNLTLLKVKKNELVGNGDFQNVKGPVYKISEYALTRALAEINGKWNKQQIEERQKYLAELAVKTWPHKLAK